MGLGALKGVGSAPAEAIKAERDKNVRSRIPLISSNGWALSSSRRRLFRSLRWPVSLIPLSLIAVSGLKMLTLSCSLLRKMKRQPTSSASSEKSRPTKCRLRKLRLGANGLEWKKNSTFWASTSLVTRWKPTIPNSNVISVLSLQERNPRTRASISCRYVHRVRAAPRQGWFSLCHTAFGDTGRSSGLQR